MKEEGRSNALYLAMVAMGRAAGPVEASGVLFSAGLHALLGATTDKGQIAELASVLLSPVLNDLGLAVVARETIHTNATDLASRTPAEPIK